MWRTKCLNPPLVVRRLRGVVLSEPEQKKLAAGSTPIENIVNAIESAPVLYVDGMQGFTLGVGTAGGMVKINLFVDLQDLVPHRPERSAPIEATLTRRVVARLVMTPQTLVAIAEWLSPKAEETRRIVGQMQPQGRPPADE